MKILSNIIERAWYGRVARWWPLLLLLWPLSLLFSFLAALRRFLLTRQQTVLSVPVIVVGNITVGGTGKTPLLCALAMALSAKGKKAGIISRGYGGAHNGSARKVVFSDDAQDVGDEPLLLALASGCPVVIGRDRVAAAQYLLQHEAIDVILSDDGLQHYALPRTVEIAVLDGQRGIGNGFCMPAGPLREPVSRLHSVDFAVTNGTGLADKKFLPEKNLSVSLVPQCWVSVAAGTGMGTVLELDAVSREKPVHAVAGIGNPARFFDTLRQMGFSLIEHPFADHHPFSEQDLVFADGLPVLMTEKDAVKCAAFAKDNCYALRVAMPLPDEWVDAVCDKAWSEKTE